MGRLERIRKERENYIFCEGCLHKKRKELIETRIRIKCNLCKDCIRYIIKAMEMIRKWEQRKLKER